MTSQYNSTCECVCYGNYGASTHPGQRNSHCSYPDAQGVRA